MVPTGQPSVQPSTQPSTQPSSPSSMPSSQPSAGPSLDVNDATSVLFNASFILDGVPLSAINKVIDRVIESGIWEVGGLLKTDTVTITGASSTGTSRKLIAEERGTVGSVSGMSMSEELGENRQLASASVKLAYYVELYTNNHTLPMKVYTAFTKNLIAGLESGALNKRLKTSGQPALVNATVSAASITIDNPKVIYAEGFEPVEPKNEKGFPLWGISVAAGGAALCATVLLGLYIRYKRKIKKKEKVAPSNPLYEGRDFDEPIKPNPVLKSFREDLYRDADLFTTTAMNAVALKNKGYHLRKVWEVEDSLTDEGYNVKGSIKEAASTTGATITTTVAITAEDSFSNLFDQTMLDIEQKEDQNDPTPNSFDLLRPSKVDLQELESIESGGDSTDEDLLDLVEQRITPKPRSSKKGSKKNKVGGKK
jgi:hypothetical protein